MQDSPSRCLALRRPRSPPMRHRRAARSSRFVCATKASTTRRLRATPGPTPCACAWATVGCSPRAGSSTLMASMSNRCSAIATTARPMAAPPTRSWRTRRPTRSTRPGSATATTASTPRSGASASCSTTSASSAMSAGGRMNRASTRFLPGMPSATAGRRCVTSIWTASCAYSATKTPIRCCANGRSTGTCSISTRPCRSGHWPRMPIWSRTRT